MLLSPAPEAEADLPLSQNPEKTGKEEYPKTKEAPAELMALRAELEALQKRRDLKPEDTDDHG